MQRPQQGIEMESVRIPEEKSTAEQTVDELKGIVDKYFDHLFQLCKEHAKELPNSKYCRELKTFLLTEDFNSTDPEALLRLSDILDNIKNASEMNDWEEKSEIQMLTEKLRATTYLKETLYNDTPLDRDWDREVKNNLPEEKINNFYHMMQKIGAYDVSIGDGLKMKRGFLTDGKVWLYRAIEPSGRMSQFIFGGIHQKLWTKGEKMLNDANKILEKYYKPETDAKKTLDKCQKEITKYFDYLSTQLIQEMEKSDTPQFKRKPVHEENTSVIEMTTRNAELDPLLRPEMNKAEIIQQIREIFKPPYDDISKIVAFLDSPSYPKSPTSDAIKSKLYETVALQSIINNNKISYVDKVQGLAGEVEKHKLNKDTSPEKHSTGWDKFIDVISFPLGLRRLYSYGSFWRPSTKEETEIQHIDHFIHQYKKNHS